MKNYCALWNILVDDEIDRVGTRKNLDSSVHVLLAEMGYRSDQHLSPAGVVLQMILELIPQETQHDKRALCFDLWELIHGCSYEHTINNFPVLANSIDYQRYSTMAASIKTHLDIDLLHAENALPSDCYRQLRRIYDHLTLAIKYSSDVGSLRRELVDENNLNLVRIEAAECGIAEIGESVSEETYSERVAELGPVIDHVRTLAVDNMTLARSLASALVNVDVKSVVDEVELMVQAYLDGDDVFFQSPKGDQN